MGCIKLFKNILSLHVKLLCILGITLPNRSERWWYKVVSHLEIIEYWVNVIIVCWPGKETSGLPSCHHSFDKWVYAREVTCNWRQYWSQKRVILRTLKTYIAYGNKAYPRKMWKQVLILRCQFYISNISM